MGEAHQDGMQNNGHPRNLLHKFTADNGGDTGFSDNHLDLSLGLSLGGFYSEIPKENPLIRSSSAAGILIMNDDDDGGGEFDPLPLPAASFLSLSRSCSLPTEAEQEQRKVRELQSLRRLEAKKRLVEKQRSGWGGSEDEKSPALAARPLQLAAWAVNSAAKNSAFCRAIDRINTHYNASGNGTVQGRGKWTTTMDPSFRSLPPVITSGTMANGISIKPEKTDLENPSKKVKVCNRTMREMEIDVMKQMPSVTTTGDGPNGRKIEGFLYKYMKGQVSIVCVCHGSFLSPAEFIKHAGVSDVANPMKHINVCCTSFSV